MDSEDLVIFSDAAFATKVTDWVKHITDSNPSRRLVILFTSGFHDLHSPTPFGPYEDNLRAALDIVSTLIGKPSDRIILKTAAPVGGPFTCRPNLHGNGGPIVLNHILAQEAARRRIPIFDEWWMRRQVDLMATGGDGHHCTSPKLGVYTVGARHRPEEVGVHPNCLHMLQTFLSLVCPDQ